MNFMDLEKCYAIKKLKNIKYCQKGLQRLIRSKRLKAILIDHYDYWNISEWKNNNEFTKEDREEIQVWLNDTNEQERPNWSDCYYISNYINNQKQLNDEAICIIKSLPKNLKCIYLCDRKGESNMAIYINLKQEEGKDIFFFFN